LYSLFKHFAHGHVFWPAGAPCSVIAVPSKSAARTVSENKKAIVPSSIDTLTASTAGDVVSPTHFSGSAAFTPLISAVIFCRFISLIAPSAAVRYVRASVFAIEWRFSSFMSPSESETLTSLPSIEAVLESALSARVFTPEALDDDCSVSMVVSREDVFIVSLNVKSKTAVFMLSE
jgi:hypothetical protein